MPGTSTTLTAAGVTLSALTTSAIRPSRSSSIGAMPTCSLPKSGPTPARVSALKSVVFPAAGSPTIPTSSTCSVSRDLLLQ